ncbi:MAG: ATP-binding protein [Woeseiaceae bacterium]|nr:ATP-binding protein [Woeseiaceae bacterium]
MKQRLRLRFRVFTIVQVVLLAASTGALMFTALQSRFIAVPIVLLVVVVLQVLALIHSVHRHVDSLEDFFAAVNYEDFTRRFIEDDVDVELKDAFNRVLARFQDARADRDLQAVYLDTVIRHVPVALIAARRDGTLSIVNNPARRLTGLPSLARLGDLEALERSLPATLGSIEAGQQRLLQTSIRGIPVELRVSVAEIRVSGETERLYSIENLSGELSARESSAWRNLIRVLTHEIMNTLTPVTSLAQTSLALLDEKDSIDDIREAIGTIGRRSENMIDFVSRYRELLQVPKPALASVGVRETLDHVASLMQGSLDGVEVAIDVSPESLEIHADRQLIEQVLINLVRNAADAVAGQEGARIALSARLDLNRVIVSVADNGPGIPDEDIEQIFIPFFTTKRDGSGVGLALSRQIMTAHNGEIAVDSGPDGTTVRLVFS